jgi:hypothetical protein
MSNRAAAQALFVTEKTVETHLASAYRKLGASSRVQLARKVQGKVEGSENGAEALGSPRPTTTPGGGAA